MSGRRLTAHVHGQLSVQRGRPRSCCATCRSRSRPGEVTTLLGPNGSGKSTLVLTVAGVAAARRRGHVLLGDHDLTKRRPEKIRQAGVAVVPEGRRLLADLSVARQPARRHLLARRARRPSAASAYALELFPELKRRWDTASPLAVGGRAADGGAGPGPRVATDGAARRRAVARPRARRGQAPRAHARRRGRVGRRRAAHRAVRPRRARPGPDRAYVLEGGRIRYDGTAQELQRQPRAACTPPTCCAPESPWTSSPGRVAVVTGAASGIGRAMAERFAAEGMRVVLADVERPVLQRAAEALTAAGARRAGRPHRRERRRRGRRPWRRPRSSTSATCTSCATTPASAAAACPLPTCRSPTSSG